MTEPIESPSPFAEQPAPVIPPPASRAALFAITIFISAFLLFEVQPLIAKQILPWFGGSAAVWTTALLFFELVLLLGYAYAHFLTSRLSPRAASQIHIALLAVSLFTLPILPSAAWKPADGTLPLLRILGLLSVTVGAPYFLLASTSPLLQSWYARAHRSSVPYRFFALSNLGSMLALISYPALVEPHLPLRMQATTWSSGYGVYVMLAIVLAWKSRSLSPPGLTRETSERVTRWGTWLALSACASALLLTVTNHISQNVAAIPFLWVLPLSLYLLSFILTFESGRWYVRRVFLGLFAVSVASMGIAIAGHANYRDIKVLVPLFCAGLFVCCMVCHGELARRKPPTHFLTAFYLTIAAGGALGGLLVAAVAPIVFPGLWEFPIALVLTAAIVLRIVYQDRRATIAAASSEYVRGSARREMERAQFWAVWIASYCGLAALTYYLAHSEYQFEGVGRLLVRNFYGALRVNDDDQYQVRILSHGTINHGEQYLDPVRRRLPISYYSRRTGIGRLMQSLRFRDSLRVGVVGLGSGVMAAWGRTGDTVRFYEINPLVLDIARSQFTYLSDSPARIEVALGDARLSLEREAPQKFDVLVVDAFSGDSIPVHLLTREAFAIYWRHLRPDGVLAVHISNRYLDLGPPVERLAHEFGRQAHLLDNEKSESDQTFASDWVLVGPAAIDHADWLTDDESEIDARPGLLPWTDDFSNLWQIVK